MPKPLYEEEQSVKPPKSSTAVGASDFQLLRLAADDLNTQESSVGLAELLHPAGSVLLLLHASVAEDCRASPA